MKDISDIIIGRELEELIVEQLLKETQTSYYEYVMKLENGCLQIANDLRTGNQAGAFQNIINLTEGLGWLLDVEARMQEQRFKINSQIVNALDFLNEVNDALEAEDIVTVADLFEYEIAPLFASASEWTFQEIQN